MIAVHDVASIRAAEERAMARAGAGALMQRAAFGLAVACAGLLAAAGGRVAGARVVVLAGSGDNGGDALWAGARLADRGCAVTAVAVADRVHPAAAAALRRAGGRLVEAGGAAAVRALVEADLVIDGIVGIGGRGALRGPAVGLLDRLGEAIVVAVDVPSGVDADTGAVDGPAVDADVTITFGALKPGLLTVPGRDRAGTVRLVDIGLEFVEQPVGHCLDDVDAARWVPEPAAEDHKYRRAVAGLATGSADYPGAGYLSVAAALGTGPGMVRVLADRTDRRLADRFWDVVVDGTAPAEQPHVTAWGAGSGLAGTADQAPLVSAVLAADVPVVLDAGALRLVADDEAVRADLRTRHARGLPTVLTPHAGEFERLAPGLLAAAPGRIAAAQAAACELGAVVVLKGPGTVVAGPSGTAYIDTEGTADLAVAGSGDVLTGLLTAVLAGAWAAGQRDADLLVQAAAAAVRLHGRAGRIAAGEGPATASGIAAAIGAAVRSVRFGPVAAAPVPAGVRR